MNAYGRARAAAARSRLYATDSQITYLRRLLDEAFAHGRGSLGTCLDRNHLNGVTKAEASRAIDALLAAKRDNWGNTDVFSPVTRRLIGTVSRMTNGAWQAYSYPLGTGRGDFVTHDEARAWVESAGPAGPVQR